MYYNIICKYKDDGLTEEVASDLSYGEMCQYLLDCFENEENPRFDLKVVEEELYNKTNKLLFNSIVTGLSVMLMNCPYIRPSLPGLL